MLFLAYIAPLLVFSVASRRKIPESIRKLIKILYSFSFLFGVQGVLRLILLPKFNFGELFQILGSSIYSTVQSITFTGTMFWSDKVVVSDFTKGQIWLIAFVASMITVHSLLATIFGKFLNQLDMKIKSGFVKDQYCILGSSDVSRVLITDIYDHVKKPYIIYIPTDKLADDDKLYALCRVEKPVFLNRLNKKKRYHIVLLPDSDYSNFDRVYMLNETDSNVKVTAFLDNDVIRFHDLHTDNIDTMLKSVDQVLVNSFFKEYTPFKLLKETHSFTEDKNFPYLKRPFEICVIGFGNIGQEFLLSSFENAAFLTETGESPFKALVIDRNASVLKQEFENKVPFFAGNNDIEFKNLEADTEEYFNVIEERTRRLHQIIVAIQDTETNVSTALSLCRYFDRIGFYDNRPQIVVVLNDTVTGVKNLFKGYPNVEIIDFNNQIFTFENINETKLDLAAKALNQKYNVENPQNASEWNSLGTFAKSSNYAAARDNLTNKIEQFRMCKGEKEETYQFLAQYEHSRWCAFHFAHGWKKLNVEDLTEEEKNQYKTKREDQKLHICLVSWDELDALPQKDKGKFKMNDYNTVVGALENVVIKQTESNN